MYNEELSISLPQLYFTLTGCVPVRVERVDWQGRPYLIGWFVTIGQFKNWVTGERRRRKRYEEEYYVSAIKPSTRLNEDTLNIEAAVHISLRRKNKSKKR